MKAIQIATTTMISRMAITTPLDGIERLEENRCGALEAFTLEFAEAFFLVPRDVFFAMFLLLTGCLDH